MKRPALRLAEPRNSSIARTRPSSKPGGSLTWPPTCPKGHSAKTMRPCLRSRMARFFSVIPLLAGIPLHAERYALLAGVSVYRNGIHGLEGPAEDIRAMKEMLVRQGYSAGNITIL